jgi:DNA-binding CsgD family transcriptional regulator
MLSCSLAGGDASRGTRIGLSSCSIPLKPIRNFKADSPRYPILVFGRTFSDDMATDRNNGANGRGAIRLSRQSNAKPVIENVNQFAKNVAAVYGALDSKEFINATFRLLQAAAPGCFAWMMLRYSDSRGAVCMSSNGLRLEDEMIAKRFYHDYPGYRFLMEHPGIKILPAKSILPESEELLMSDLYWLCMLPMGWRHALGLCFWEERSLDGLDCIFWIHRTSALGDFTAAEIKLLENLYPLIDDARRRINKLQAERSTLHSLEELVRDLPLATAVLDWHLRPVYHNQAGSIECARWRVGTIKAERADFKVPHDLTQMCREMKREWCDTMGSGTRPARIKREAQGMNQNMRAIITLIPSGDAAIGNPSFLLQFVSFSKVKAVVGEKNLALLAQLTPEERVVASLICEGKSNDDISTQLAKSIWTVKRQIYSIFRKLHLTNRTQLVMLLLQVLGE